MPIDDIKHVVPEMVRYKQASDKGYWSFQIFMNEEWDIIVIVCSDNPGQTIEEKRAIVHETLSYVNMHMIPTYGMQIVGPVSDE